MRHLHPVDDFALLDAVDPDAYGTGNNDTAWVDVSSFAQVLGVIQSGSNSGVIPEIRQAKDASGTDAKAVSGAAISADTTNDAQWLISLQVSSLDIENGFTHVQLRVRTTATTDASGLIFGVHPRNGPASDSNGSTVVEVVRV